MLKALLAMSLLLAPAGVPARSEASAGYHLISGTFDPGRGPDGNSIFLEAPEGLILVDTGRHPEHAERLLRFAGERSRPIVAIVNTHWHLDHASGNREVRAAFPRAEVYASDAIEGALTGFLRRNLDAVRRRLEAGEVPETGRAEALRFIATMDDPGPLRPTRRIAESATLTIGGRRLALNLARFAATEGDIWIHDPAARLVIAGDLVVAQVPFMDTACPEGWRAALDAIAATRFETLIPGHGAPMTRSDFLRWRRAFANLIDCAGSARTRADCVAGWRRDAAPFIPQGREAMTDEYVGYYVDTRLRAGPGERQRYCRGASGRS